MKILDFECEILEFDMNWMENGTFVRKKQCEVAVFAGKPRGRIRVQGLLQEFAYEFCS